MKSHAFFLTYEMAVEKGLENLAKRDSDGPSGATEAAIDRRLHSKSSPTFDRLLARRRATFESGRSLLGVAREPPSLEKIFVESCRRL